MTNQAPIRLATRRAPTRRWPGALVALATLLGAAPATAQPEKAPASSDEASTRFRAGVAFYKDGDFAAALVEFKRAYELAPNYRVLFNLGQTSQELNDYASALTAFRGYLAGGGKEIDAKRKADVEKWIASLEKKVGAVTIEASVEGAELSVDDLPVGAAPLADPVIVNAGRRKFAASAEGYVPMSRVVEIAGQDASTVRFELVPIEAPRGNDGPRDPEPTRPAPAPPESGSAAPWIALGITGAAGIATIVFGSLATSASGDLDDALATYPGSTADIDDAYDRTSTMALATDVLGGVTIAGAVTTVVLFIATSGGDEPAPTESAVSVQVSPFGVGLSGRF